MIRQNGQPSLFTIFTSFLRLGSTAFGGAAMVAYIRRMAVQQKGWLDDASFRDGVAFCQTVPGATAMQVAAYSRAQSRRRGRSCRRLCGLRPSGLLDDDAPLRSIYAEQAAFLPLFRLLPGFRLWWWP